MYVDYRRQLSLAIFLVLLTVGLALRNPAFASPANLRDVCVNASHLGIAALGMFLVILIGQIDVSVGAILAICSSLAGLMAKQGVPTPVVALGAVLAGALLGGLNGLIVAGLRIHSIVVTLGTASNSGHCSAHWSFLPWLARSSSWASTRCGNLASKGSLSSPP